MSLDWVLGDPIWEREDGVECVVCPVCAFTFDAAHEDTTGGYSCPACAEVKLREILALTPAFDLDDLLLIRELLRAAPEPPADLVARVQSSIAANGV